ncbi:AbrB family transcriptional regulator [Paracoccus luteus]|uniref:AbrB family transcriptional regulator n=1 Tax=Paracoccus luteus TaxID=2508543 RepID=UPI001FE955ED|nr:AbrB family transcriptional regulator [Paracoccus luteus]
MQNQLFRGIATVAIALAGTAAFLLLALPLPFLFGPMLACLIAALAGVRLRGLGQVSVGARTILGVAVGASITPEVVARIPQMMLSVALIPVYIALIALIGVPYFRRMGFDPVTSYYAAMPGGLQDMVIFGTEAGGDPRALSLIHATRVAMIVTVAPILLSLAYGAPLTGAVGAPAADLPPAEMAIMAAAALIGWKGAERIGLFGATILGPMIVTTVLALTDIIHSRPPAEAILAAQFFIGIGIGVNYVGVTLRELRRFVASGLIFVLILAVITGLMTEVVTLFGLAQGIEGFLAFAPGGQAEMTVLAIIVGADLGFVVVHHLTRIVLVILGAPLGARLAVRARRKGPPPR